MRIVTGTKRSGTSMWMQILEAAGFETLGKRFPGAWETSIRDCNPHGFYESKFRQGVFFATNPDPRTGAFVRPETVDEHVVKVFIPGLIRSDWAFVGPVLATMRNWREYTSSLTRLYEMEKTWHASKKEHALGDRDSPSEHRVRQGRLPPALEWWFENYELIRDVSERGYAFHMTTYDRVLRDPKAEISPVVEWFGGGDVKAAVEAVAPTLRTQANVHIDDARVDADAAVVFDELYAAVDGGSGLSAAFISKMNETHERLVTRWDEERAEALRKRSAG